MGWRAVYSCEMYRSKTNGGSMRKIALLVLVLSALCWAQSNAGEYAINVHVTSSQWVVVPTTLGLQTTQKSNVIIDGKKYELEAQAKAPVTLLSLGDYNAKLIEDVHKTAYESTQPTSCTFPTRRQG